MPGDSFVILHAYPSPQLESKWLQCLTHSISPEYYASPGFFREPYFRKNKLFAVLALINGEVAGVLTGLCEHGIVTSGLETRAHLALDTRYDPNKSLLSLLQGVERESRGAKLVQVYSWNALPLEPFVNAGYRRRGFPGNPVLDLSLGPEILFQQCGSSQRRNIRLAIKKGVEIIEATTREDFEAFYSIYEQWCTAKQLPHNFKELEWEAFQTTQSNRRLFLAKYEGQIVAGSGFRFFPGGLIVYARNSSRPEFLRFKPNDPLLWHAIEWACHNGFTHFSMGGNHKFLRGFGGQIMPIDRYRLDRTILRRYDLKDMTRDASRAALHRLPLSYQKRIRKILHHEIPSGW